MICQSVVAMISRVSAGVEMLRQVHQVVPKEQNPVDPVLDRPRSRQSPPPVQHRNGRWAAQLL